MTSEQPPRDALRPYRPLPSIDIPLLREERSAVRSRRLVRIAIAGISLATLSAFAAVGAHYVTRGENDTSSVESPAAAPELVVQPASTEGATAAPSERPSGIDSEIAAGAKPSFPDEEPPEPEGASPLATGSGLLVASKTQHTFGKALSFRDALEKNGLSRDESNELIAALDGPMDFRRSQPEDVFTIERDSQGKLVRFEYRSGLTQRYEAVRSDAGKLNGRQIEIPIRAVRVMKGGTVQGSLGDSLEGLKLGRSLAGVFTEVFEGQVNFSTDTREGDSFRIIVEEEYVEGNFLRYGNIHAIEYKGAKAGTLQAFWHESKNVDGDFYDATGRALHGGWLRTPLRYDHISSPFGYRMHPVLKRRLLHNGIDYSAGTGTPVRAAAAGVVTFAGPKGPNGNLLAIAHSSGFESFYAHLSRFAPGMKKGAKVSQRQVIAYVGSTGRSTGPHLHFSLKKNGRFLDPKTQLNGPGLPMPPKDLPEFKRRVRDLTSALARVPIQKPAPVVAATPAAGAVDLGEEEL